MALAVALVCAAPAAAHHSPSLLYQTDKQVVMEGVVTRFSIGNPHLRIYFTRTGEDGVETEWMGEGGSRTVLLRNGWTGHELKAGDRIVIFGNPAREDVNLVRVLRVTLPDGRELYAEDAPGLGRLDELRTRRPAGGDPAGE